MSKFDRKTRDDDDLWEKYEHFEISLSGLAAGIMARKLIRHELIIPDNNMTVLDLLYQPLHLPGQDEYEDGH